MITKKFCPWKDYDVVKVGEHDISIPVLPKKAITIPSLFGGEVTIPLDELILYRKEKKDDALWKRVHDLPDFFWKYNPDPEAGTSLYEEETKWEGGTLTSLNYEDSTRLKYLYDREMFRRTWGVHFKNGDKYEYLTGDHYFILEYGKMYAIVEEYAVDKFYGRFLNYQKEWAYVMQHAENDPNILGAFCAKPKKTGITQFMSLCYLNKSTLLRMRQMGMMSKGQDAADVNMLYYLHGFDGLPMIFKPVIKNRADKMGEIIFGEPPVRNTRTRKGQERQAQLADIDPLNNRVWAAKTKEAGFDSPKMYWIWFDELAKYDTENKQEPEKVFIRNQETVKIQSRITGKIWITFYPPERDTLGFFQTRTIWENSKLSTRKGNDLGRTKSGLITYYISALNSHIDAFDQWGYCNMKEAKRLNDIERNAVKHDKKLYQAKVRQYSETERECWSSAGAGSTFDNVRLGEIEYDLMKELEHTVSFEEGKLEWDNELWEQGGQDRRPWKSFTNVKWVPLTEEEKIRGEEGRLRIYQHPPPKEICAALRMGRDKWGNLLPLPIFNSYGGIDPTEYADGAEVNEGSKSASITMNFKDPELDAIYRRIVTNIITSVYFFRPDNPEEGYQDIVKEILYFGKRVIVEANKAWLATRLIKDGLGYYMIVRDKADGFMKAWRPEMLEANGGKGYSLIRTGKSKDGEESDHEAIVRAIAKFIAKPPLGEIDYGKLIKDERIIKQLQDFNPKVSQFYDLVMALGYTRICGGIMSESYADSPGPDLTRNDLEMIFRQLSGTSNRMTTAS